MKSPELQQQLRCPVCRIGRLEARARTLTCASCFASYPIVGERPVLMRPDNKVFRQEDYIGAGAPAAAAGGIGRLIPSPSVNLASERVLARLRALLGEKPARLLVVGGGRQRSWLDQRFRDAANVSLVYCDVDVDADVDLFCDAHDLPFEDRSFEGVITTAVLEHVLYPERVASEIARVVKPGGFLYSELPFMQQVHEGAYDFTRYTLSGHRRLFRDFAEIESGMVAGPGTALVWAIENFCSAFVTGARARQVAKALVRVGFGWIKHADRLL